MLVTQLNSKGDFRKGTKGAKAKIIQQCLKNAGYNLGKHGIDSSWGGDTDEAFRLFQKDHGLEVDGWAGDNTLYELMFYFYPHFRKEEFKCKCGKYCNGYPVKLDENLLVFLEKIRSKLGNKSININSAIRCKTWNKIVGGVSDSRHMEGKAVDFNAVNSNSLKESQVANSVVGSKGAVLRYITKNFVHIDTRGTRTRVTYK